MPQLNHIETILDGARRQALVSVIRSRPELTLDKLQDCFRGPHGPTLRSITVGELLQATGELALPKDGGPPIDPVALEEAKRLKGEAFDRRVLEAILGAHGEVSASYLRARVGGPRWKLQASLRRLVDDGHISRRGVTSSTRYESTDALDS
ncbi:hypothetical protein G6O69_21615 [Pseudenhygromyxa sp. WMMC2535]|uniref:hypothetical protein n=1 Tax=Pseudenhygromyxa sp. WMMC2535 TaxID=2712867 RepID=UPI001555FFA2|nr:hypothetical protein [Pseudenhygromyxa sp. WMMC2535]NVB40453.1 hypothetical protein [Pseudenhygromyxa sp. WMMC2535]